MYIEILLSIQILLLMRLIKAVKGPEIIYHRRKRLSLFWEDVKSFLKKIIGGQIS